MECPTKIGYWSCTAFSKYSGMSIRNNVILRIDILDLLTDVFSQSYMRKYRTAIFKIISARVADPDIISTTLQLFYKSDETFQNFLGEIYYFGECSPTDSFYTTIIKSIRKSYENQYQRVFETLRGAHYKVIGESDGYLYFSVPDVQGLQVIVPRDCRKEIISRAKNWEGLYREL